MSIWVILIEMAVFAVIFTARVCLFPGIIFALIPAALVGWFVTLIR